MNRLIGLILITPLFWVVVSTIIWKIIDDGSEEKIEGVAVFGAFITLALWGVIVLLGWV